MGIYMDNSINNSVNGNEASDNIDHGILLFNNSRGNALAENRMEKNGWGVLLAESSHNILIDNIARKNYYGLYLSSSEGNNISQSTLSENIYNFGDIGFKQPNSVDRSNTADGKRIYYLVGQSEITLDGSSKAGAVYCINCRNITIRGLSFSNSSRAVYFKNTTGSNISGNAIRLLERHLPGGLFQKSGPG